MAEKIIAATKAGNGGGGGDDSREVRSTEPVVRQYERQFHSDFGDGEPSGGRDLPSVHEIDSAMPLSDDAEAVVEAAETEKAKPEAFSRRGKTPEPEEPAVEAAKPEAPAAETAKAVMSREERRKFLADLSAESERRTQEQTVHAEKARIAGLEAKLKGPLADRLALVFPELAGQPDAARDRLIEMLVAGQVTPATGEAPKPVEADDRIGALQKQIDELKGTSPTNPENVAAARLRHVVSTMQADGQALPFAEREGNAAYDLGVKIAKSMYAMQGNKGQVDGARVMQVVEQHFEDAFVAKYGEAASAALKGVKPATAVAAATTTTAAVVATAQRRPGARKVGAGTPGSDPLPLDSPAKRHRAMQAEIDAMEGTFRGGGV